MCWIRNIVLFLTAVGAGNAQYHVYEDNVENVQNVGYDSPGPLTGGNIAGELVSYGGAGRYNVHPTVKYVTPHVTSYEEPVKTIYSGPTSYTGAGDHSSVGYGGALAGYDALSGRVRVQVYRGPTLTSGFTHYAPWGFYVIQPSNGDTGNSYGY